jgi:hypothetical protein
MQRADRINLLLLLAVALLSTLTLLEPGGGVSQPGPLTPIQPGTVQSITIDHQKHGRTRLVRRSPLEWQVVEPRSLPANRVRAELLARVVAMSRHATLTLEGDPARYGLSPPQAVVALNGLEILFGGIEPIGGRRYVTVAGELVLIDDTVYPLLNQPWSDWIDLALLPPTARLRQVDWPAGDSALLAEDGWRRRPVDLALSLDRLHGRIQSLRTLRAHRITLAEPPAGEVAELRLWFEGQEEPLRYLLHGERESSRLYQPESGLDYHITSAARLLLLAGNPEQQGE